MDLVNVNSQVGNKEMNALITEFNASQDEYVKSYASLHPMTEGHNADDSFSVTLYFYSRLFHMKEDFNYYIIWNL